MAKQQIVPGRCRKVVRTGFFDGKGRPQTHLDFMIEEIADEDGVEERSFSPSISLADGTIWSSAMARGDKPVLLAQCRECQKPGHDQGANGLMLAKNAVRCEGSCGSMLCPSHRQRMGRKWLCPSCYRKHRLLKPISSLLRAIFFVRVEE